MRAIRRLAGAMVGVAIALTLALVLWAGARRHPGDLPWAPLDLGQPVGAFTGRKLTRLTGDTPRCMALLDRAGIAYTRLAPLHPSHAQCGYDDGVRLQAGGSARLRFSPAGLGVSCPVAAGLAMWEWDVVQPAAQRLLGARVVTIEHFGSYNCRRMYGRDAGPWSEHATADAVDIAGFRLADGTRITIAGDWSDTGAKGRFLHAVRDGGCRLFATVLSPEYNAAHRDHLHLDQAERGGLGWRACR